MDKMDEGLRKLARVNYYLDQQLSQLQALSASYQRSVEDLEAAAALNSWKQETGWDADLPHWVTPPNPTHEILQVERSIQWIQEIKARLFGCQDTTLETTNLVRGVMRRLASVYDPPETPSP